MSRREPTVVPPGLAWACIGGSILLFYLCLVGPGLSIAAAVVTGPVAYPSRVLPAAEYRAAPIAVGALYFAALAVTSHLFLRWLYREWTGGRSWRLKWTAGLLTLVVICFVAGSAAVGVAHQSAWLASSTQPWFKPTHNRERANRIKCASNMHQIGLALLLYANENHGRYPDELVDLLTTEQIAPDVFVCPSSNAEKAIGTAAEIRRDFADHCSYVYYGKGLVDPLPADRVIATEPLDDHDDGMNVLYRDGHVDWLDRPAAEKLLATTRPTTAPAAPTSNKAR